MIVVDDDPSVLNYLAVSGAVDLDLVAEAVARPAGESLDDASLFAAGRHFVDAAAAVEYFVFGGQVVVRAAAAVATNFVRVASKAAVVDFAHTYHVFVGFEDVETTEEA